MLAGELAEHRDDLLLAAQVEVGERLVEQEQLRPGDQRVRDQHALLLAAGQLADPGVGVPVRADVGQRRLDQFPALPRREAEPEPVPVKAKRHHVAGAQRHVGVDDQLLRHVADGGLVLVVQRRAVDEHPPARRLDQAEDDAEQRGLARAVRADDPGEVALLERERDVAEHLAAAEAHADAFERQQWHGGPHRCSVETWSATAVAQVLHLGPHPGLVVVPGRRHGLVHADDRDVVLLGQGNERLGQRVGHLLVVEEHPHLVLGEQGPLDGHVLRRRVDAVHDVGLERPRRQVVRAERGQQVVGDRLRGGDRGAG